MAHVPVPDCDAMDQLMPEPAGRKSVTATEVAAGAPAGLETARLYPIVEPAETDAESAVFDRARQVTLIVAGPAELEPKLLAVALAELL